MRLFPRPRRSIGHDFRVACSCCVKTSLPAKPHIGKCVPLIGLFSSTHFHMRGFAQRLVLKKRYKTTRKSLRPEVDWPRRNIETWELGICSLNARSSPLDRCSCEVALAYSSGQKRKRLLVTYPGIDYAWI